IEYFVAFCIIHLEHFFEAHCEINKAGDKFICDRNIAACLIRHMYFVSLVVQAHKRSAHADDVVIRMWGKYQATLGIWFTSFRVRRYHSIWLPARPAGDAVAEQVIYLEVYFICFTF